VHALPWPCSRSQVDDQLAIEGFCDAQQGVDSGRPPPGLETRDGRLGGATELRQLRLGKLMRSALLDQLLGDAGEEPALIPINVSEALAQPFERTSARSTPGSHV
jgi:hypothetical protein